MAFWELLASFCCCGSQEGGLRPIRSNVEDWRQHPIVQQYNLLDVIGEGGFSEIWLAEHQITKDKAALKVVYLSKPGLNKTQASVLEGEAKFLQLLDHPSILHCREVLETKFDLVLVLEHLSGGELLDHLRLVHHFDEGQAAALMRQVVEAVAYMHDLSIMHRDIKPENVLFCRPVEWYRQHKQPWKVKLIDLGMAGVFSPTSHVQGCLGSPGFIAPEIVHGGHHSPAMDIYSLGALLFVMLTGRKVWDIRDVHTLQCAQLSIDTAPGLKDSRFKACSPAVQELILMMMADDPTQRPTAHQVLSHAWIRGESGDSARPVIDSVVRRRMLQLANLRRYKGLAFTLMTHHDPSSTTHGSVSGFSSFSSLASLDDLEAPSHVQHVLTGSNLSPRPHHVQGGVQGSAQSMRPSHSPHASEIQPLDSAGVGQQGGSRNSTPLRRAPDSLLQAIHRQRKLVHHEMKSRALARRQGGTAGADSVASAQLAPAMSVTRAGRHQLPGKQLKQQQQQQELTDMTQRISTAGCGGQDAAGDAEQQGDAGSARTAGGQHERNNAESAIECSTTGGDAVGDTPRHCDGASSRLKSQDGGGAAPACTAHVQASVPVEAGVMSEGQLDGWRASHSSLLLSHTSQEALITDLHSDAPQHLFRQPAAGHSSRCVSPADLPAPAASPKPMLSAFATHDLPPGIFSAVGSSAASSRVQGVQGVPAAKSLPRGSRQLPSQRSSRELERGLHSLLSIRRHQGAMRSTSDGGGGEQHRQSVTEALELALVATALQAAPQLSRAWTAPETGTIPNVLENAMGAAVPRLFQVGQQARAMSLDMMTLAFLDGEQNLRQLLGDAAGDLLMGCGSLRRRVSEGSAELPLSLQPGLLQEVLSFRDELASHGSEPRHHHDHHVHNVQQPDETAENGCSK